MRKILLSLSALALSVLMTHAQITDVTSSYLTNPSFETDAAAGDLKNSGSTTPTGWTLTTTATSNCQYGVANASTTIQGIGSTFNPSDGSNYYYIRCNWNSNKPFTLSQEAKIPTGTYRISMKYATYSNTSTVPEYTFKATDGTTTQSETYCVSTSAWNTASLVITKTTDANTALTISASMEQKSQNGGQHVVLIIDDVTIESVDLSSLEKQTQYFTGTFEDCSAATASATASGTAATTGATNGEWTYSESATWSCSAIIAYNQSDVQLNSVSAPSADNAGSTGNALGVSVGWGGTELWKQTTAVTLPAGTYILKYSAYNNNTGAASMISKVGFVAKNGTEYLSDKTLFTNGSWDTDYVTFTLSEATEGNFQVGGKAFSIGSGSNAKVFFDNLTLTYLDPLAGAKEDYAAALTAAKTAAAGTDPVNGDVKTALRTAISTYSSVSSTVESDYTTATEALTSATTAYNNSVKAYATAANVLPKMLALTQSTNFYTAAAKETYYGQWKTKYDDGTLTTDEANALQDPTSIGYHVANTADDFLLNSWTDANTTDWAQNTLYINTWSAEGNTDGSEMTVPFFEYWGPSSNILAAKTLTGTLSGLKANQLYSVSALVRVQVQNNGTNGKGITMQVGDGTAVDVCGGIASATAGYYYGTFIATGKTDASGNLTLKFIVAEGNNISWLSFKNVNYAEASVDVSALNSAIIAAEAVNSSITNGVSALATEITTAKGLLESTDQDAIDTEVTKLTTATTSAKEVVAARLKANGYYKKYTALNKVINNGADNTEIAALKTVYENADATVDDVTSAINAVTLLNGYEKLTIANGTFDTDINIAADGTNSGTSIQETVFKITDWTWDGTFAATASHAATAVYGASSSSIKGTCSTNSPAADMFGESEGGTLQMSSGWGDMVRYTQDVKLPAGKYVFYYEAYNANTATGLDANYFGIRNLSVVPSDVKATSGDPSAKQGTGDIIYANENTKTFDSGEWTASAMSFTLVQNEDNAKVAIGLIGGKANVQGSGKAAKLWVDNVEVYYIPATMETYERTATSSGYGTICLPYAAKAADNVTVYNIAGVDDTEKPTTLYLSTVSEMEAGKPYIYYAGDGTTAADAVFTQTSTVTVTEPVAGENNLTGVFTSTLGGVANGSYILSGGKWYEVDNSSSFNLGDNRAYISSFTGMAVVSAAGTTEVKAMSVTGDDATAISGVENASKLVNGDIYTLSGQRVSNVTKGGIYIVNGKKVFVK